MPPLRQPLEARGRTTHIRSAAAPQRAPGNIRCGAAALRSQAVSSEASAFRPPQSQKQFSLTFAPAGLSMAL